MGRIKDEAFFQMVHDYLKIYLPSQTGICIHSSRFFMWNNAAQGIPCQMTMSGNFSGVMEHQQGKTVLKFRKMCIRIFGGTAGRCTFTSMAWPFL